MWVRWRQACTPRSPSLGAKPCGRTAVRLYNGVGEGESRFLYAASRERSSRFPLSFLSAAKNLLLATMRFFGLRPQNDKKGGWGSIDHVAIGGRTIRRIVLDKALVRAWWCIPNSLPLWQAAVAAVGLEGEATRCAQVGYLYRECIHRRLSSPGAWQYCCGEDALGNVRRAFRPRGR